MINLKEIGLAIALLFVLGACKKKVDETPLISNYEEGEDMPGGTATVQIDGVLAFSSQIRNTTSEELSSFFVGNSFFKKDWVIAPASTTARDGLGPFFNSKACATCHFLDGRGRPPRYAGERNHGLLLRLSITGEGTNGEPLAEPNYGGQLQTMAIPSVMKKGDFYISYETIPGQYTDGTTYELKKPIYNLTGLNYGTIAGDVMISPRVAPQMIGLGLLEALSDVQILANEDVLDRNNDGISGKANYVWDKTKQKKVLGRFGWKANEPNLRQQNADAFLGDIGITSSINPIENCLTGDCQTATNGGTPEFEDTFLDDLEVYTQTLAPPYRKNASDPTVLRGKSLFYSMKCISCHIPSYITGSHKISALVGQKIFPYTDMLLHDMGEDLSDNRPDFEAEGNEWRTQPLWGIGKIEKINKHTRYLHDGRARNLEEAVLWHGGEAIQQKNTFLGLDKSDRYAVITFLNSL